MTLYSWSRFIGSATSGGTFTLPATGAGVPTSGSATLRVTFAHAPATVTLYATAVGTGGHVSPSGAVPAEVGSMQTFDFIPTPNTKFDLERVWLTDSNGNELPNGDITEKVKADGYKYTLKVEADTWIRCSFKEPANGETPDIPEETITKVSVSYTQGGSISPNTQQTIREKSERGFIIKANAGYQLSQLMLGNTDVTSEVSATYPDMYILTGEAAAKEADSNHKVVLSAVFEKASKTFTIDIGSTSGGSVSPSGKREVTAGEELPLNFCNDSGKRASEVQLTLKNPDGSTYVKSIPVSGKSYTLNPVPENLVAIDVVFVDASGNKPANFRQVSARVDGVGGTIVDASLQKVTQGGAATFQLKPNPGYRAKSAIISGEDFSLIDAGDTVVIVEYRDLPSSSNTAPAELVVQFEKYEANDKATVEVDVTVDVNVDFNVSTRASIGWDEAEKGKGGFVYPSKLQLTSEEMKGTYSFFVYPNDNYKLVNLAAKMHGETIQLDWSRMENGQLYIPNANNLGNSGAVRSGTVGAPLGQSDGIAQQDDGISIGSRYYEFQLTGISADVEVLAQLVPLEEGEVDDAIVGNGKDVTFEVSYTKGGSISPADTMTMPAGTKYPFTVKADRVGTKTSLVLKYADGSTELLMGDNVKNGINVIEIKEGLKSIHAAFDDSNSGFETVAIDAVSIGAQYGSMSPTGRFSVEKGRGKSQLFTFTFVDANSCLTHLWVAGADGIREDLVAEEDVDKFDTSFLLRRLTENYKIEAEFGHSDEANPNFVSGEELFETISTNVYVQNIDGTQTKLSQADSAEWISPTGVKVNIGGGQQFLLTAKEGYILDSATVTRGSGVSASHQALTAGEIAAGKYVVEGVTENVVIDVYFIPSYYIVNVSSGKGGKLVPDGECKVQQGTNLYLAVQPDTKHEFEKFVTSGLVAHLPGASAAATSLEGQSVNEVAVANARAGQQEAFAVAGRGTVVGNFKEKSEPVTPVPDPTPGTPDNPDNPNSNPATQLTVKSSSSGHGTIDPEGTRTLAKGSKLTFTLKPEVGYQPLSITYKAASGEKTISNTTTTYAMTLEENCEIVANFAPVGVAGSNTPAARVLRTLKSLAATGDAQVMGILVLSAVACAAMGVAILSTGRNRRRKKEAVSKE